MLRQERPQIVLGDANNAANRCATRSPASIQRRIVLGETSNSSATCSMVKNFGMSVVLRAPARARSPEAGETKSAVKDKGRDGMLTSYAETQAEVGATDTGRICLEIADKLSAILEGKQSFT
jgi:hypothetical protein